MPLFSQAVVKMGKGCKLTTEDWMNAVRKQDNTDAEIERRRDKYESFESTDPIAIQELSDERLGIYLDGGRTWKDIQGECEIDD
tara:strand:+ start:680 stop:931 length:252 start_codon:yes stop_codon:yes gene_type:complete